MYFKHYAFHTHAKFLNRNCLVWMASRDV